MSRNQPGKFAGCARFLTVALVTAGHVATAGAADGPTSFDGGRFGDLAIGVINEWLGATPDTGAVNVLYGSNAGGLTAAGDQFWHQDVAGVVDSAELSDGFGRSLALGDFDGDGYADLAIGVPYESIGTVTSCGAVHVLYGGGGGLTAAGDQFWHQDSPGIYGAANQADGFGLALAVGDFDGDAYDDLAVGVPGENVGTVGEAGAVNVIYGSSAGLASARNQLWTQDSEGILSSAEEDDHFGYELAAGDFDNDGHDDLAVGVPLEDIGTLNSAGAVNVIYGTPTGLTGDGNWWLIQDTTDIADFSETGDMFGSGLATGDFDGDGFDDLAVGVPWEDNGTVENTGAVHVFYGSGGGLSMNGNWWFHQSTAGILDSAEVDDRFGLALAAGDFNGDIFADLAIGILYEDVASIENAGAVNVLYGSQAGLTADGNQFWHQDVSGVLDTAEEWDSFGGALAALPPRAIVFADGFESGTTLRWSSTAL